ncbi:MAG: hypothetical protein ACKPAF_02325, partial [Actinomycetota bacterium]
LPAHRSQTGARKSSTTVALAVESNGMRNAHWLGIGAACTAAAACTVGAACTIGAANSIAMATKFKNTNR